MIRADGGSGGGGSGTRGKGEGGERQGDLRGPRERVCESGLVVVEERGSVVERPSRCGHELRRSGNVGSV